MGNRYMMNSGLSGYPPAPSSPRLSLWNSTLAGEQDKYLSDLLAERQKLSPFTQVLPYCSRLLNQEIVRMTGMVGSSSFNEPDGLGGLGLNLSLVDPLQTRAGSLGASGSLPPPDLSSWNPLQAEHPIGGHGMGVIGGPSGQSSARDTSQLLLLPHANNVSGNDRPGGSYNNSNSNNNSFFSSFPSSSLLPHQHLPSGGSLFREGASWHQSSSHGTSQGSAGGPVVKKTRRIGIPTDQHPDFNFVGRLLGPRGNSLKRVEAQTGCRVMIRGRGSIRDAAKEERLRDKPGHEHLSEPLHVVVEAELPAAIIDARLAQAVEILEGLMQPAEESLDAVKRDQLRELAMLNGTLREESPGLLRGSSPFPGTPGMKRAKTRR
eukprot:TRINITY_DN1565_c0_g1_i1.p1 TRINITY_DN1565_c0_g1~~TRINITY_DN1565_c0_g1_i1.p1  ORF type:complete len:377 (-),score=48.24 TRINITY_DN1565_c0_g1_i1:679-1809(-)